MCGGSLHCEPAVMCGGSLHYVVSQTVCAAEVYIML